MSVAIIPARGGSRRIEKKNIKTFHGKPILAYSIEAAHASRLFDWVVVSTDDPEIAKVAKIYGAEVYLRPDEYAVNEVGTQAVVQQYLLAHGHHRDTVCCIYATSPLMDVLDLAQGYKVLRANQGANYVMSVGYPPLQDAAQFYWGWAEAFREGAPLIGPLTKMIHVAPERVCDINTHEDWARAELMYTALMEKQA